MVTDKAHSAGHTAEACWKGLSLSMTELQGDVLYGKRVIGAASIHCDAETEAVKLTDGQQTDSSLNPTV